MTSKLSHPASYLFIIITILSAILFPLFIWGVAGKDHFAAIPLKDDSTYYRNYGDWLAKEIQDRDIFYHHIGKSIEYARQADIILLGHSMLLWALRDDLVKEFEKKHRVKIYNLGSAGDGSGEFLRMIIKRWGLKPKLWVINADDQAANFFKVSLDDFGAFGKSSAISVVKYGRFKSYLNVGGRNLRWRMEDYMFNRFPEGFRKSLFPSTGFAVWRNIETGNWYLENLPHFVNPKNPLIKLSRSQDCHTYPAEVEQAKSYLSAIGGSTVLMLIPYTGFCPQRVRELADELKVETVMPPNVAFTTADGGQHLDKRGSIAFTRFFLSALEKTEAFKKITPT